MPRPLSSRTLFIAGLALMAAGVVARAVLGDALNAYADYVGPSGSLELTAATHLVEAVNLLLPLVGAGLFSASFVVAALTPS